MKPIEKLPFRPRTDLLFRMGHPYAPRGCNLLGAAQSWMK
jgi:hypothetical protein